MACRNQVSEKGKRRPDQYAQNPVHFLLGSEAALGRATGIILPAFLKEKIINTRKNHPQEKTNTSLSLYRKRNTFFNSTRIMETPEVSAKPSEEEKAWGGGAGGLGTLRPRTTL